jgi:biotin carboxylase
VLATDRCHVLEDPWGDHAIPVRFEDAEGSRDVLAAAGPFDGVVAVADRPTMLAALTAETLGIPYHSPAAVAACRDKYLTRQRFQAAGLPVPEFFRFSADADPLEAAKQASFPCVLKPLGLSASRGVIRANNAAEFVTAAERIRAMLESDRFIQVESFIEGREFALEGVVTNGELQVLALFDKPDPLDGPFFEETIYVTVGVQPRIKTATESAIRALGLTHGPIHAEMRVNRSGVWMLEVAARPIGGLCARALRFDDDGSLEELILRHAVGVDVSRAVLRDAASGVMMIPIPKGGIYQGVEGIGEASAVPNVDEVIITAKEGQKILPLPEGASYLGFIFARGDSPERVERALREAHACLKFEISTALPVVRATPPRRHAGRRTQEQ